LAPELSNTDALQLFVPLAACQAPAVPFTWN
jgi:hypothetical protein